MSEFEKKPVSVTAVDWTDDGNVRFEFGGIGQITKGDVALVECAAELRAALEDLVRVNEEHNDAVCRVIRKPPNWNDAYLNRARDIIAKSRNQVAYAPRIPANKTSRMPGMLRKAFSLRRKTRCQRCGQSYRSSGVIPFCPRCKTNRNRPC